MSDWDAGGEPIPVQVSGGPGERDEGRTERRADRSAGTGGEDLAELVTELEATLRQLRTEVDESGRPATRGSRRAQPSLPRPPSPRELLRFTETYTIPSVVAVLEAAIRALELLAGAIRLLDGRDPRTPERRDRDGADVLADVSAAAGERAATSGREALARVDDALAELQRTYEGDPADPTARRLLADARALREEIDDRLATAEPRGDARKGQTDDPDRDRGPTVDVDAELASLKEQSGREETPDDGGDSAPADGENEG